MAVDTKSCAERRCQQSLTRGGADEGKVVEVDLYRSRGRSFVDHDVNAVVLHGGVEILFDDRAEPVYLIDEQDIIGLE
jgi:hypothetical protein